jgi:hypothetical protein
MMNMSIGIVELFVTFILLILSLGIPVAILVLLYKVYTKLKDIEEQLKKQ